MFIDYRELQQLKKQTNESPIIQERWPGWRGETEADDDPRPIYGQLQTYKDILWAFRQIIDHIKKEHPADWKRGFPPKIIQWYEDEQQRQVVRPGKGNFVRIPYWLIDEGLLGKDNEDNPNALTPAELKVLVVYARYAYFGQGIREEAGFKIRHGETFVSVATVAEEAGMCESNARKAVSSLTQKGHLVEVDRQWDGKRNRCLRLVSFMLEMRDPL